MTDADDLAAMVLDGQDIDEHRQAIADRHVLDGQAPVMLSLSRIAGLAEQLAVEIRFVTKALGGEQA